MSEEYVVWVDIIGYWIFRTISVSSRECFVPGHFVPLDVSSQDVSSHIYVYMADFKV